MFNASIEITKADRYPNIRLFTTKLIASEVPKEELMGILQPWQVASAGESIIVVNLHNNGKFVLLACTHVTGPLSSFLHDLCIINLF